MAINSINSNSNLSVTQLKEIQIAKNKEAVKEQKDNLTTSKDTVKLSDRALEKQKEDNKLEQAQKAESASITDTARSKRLEELKAQIKNGEFKVDSNAIANKLTQNKEELGILLNR